MTKRQSNPGPPKGVRPKAPPGPPSPFRDYWKYHREAAGLPTRPEMSICKRCKYWKDISPCNDIGYPIIEYTCDAPVKSIPINPIDGRPYQTYTPCLPRNKDGRCDYFELAGLLKRLWRLSP